MDKGLTEPKMGANSSAENTPNAPEFICPNGFGEHLFSNVYSTWDV